MPPDSREGGATSYNAIMAMCKERRDDIHIWVTGGLAALDQMSLGHLRSSAIHWHAATQSGVAHSKNCVTGLAFRSRARDKERAGTAPAPVHGAAIGRNYIEQVSFREIVRICTMHGDSVIVGVNDGGIRALMRMDPSEVLTRLYKYDWAATPIPPKDFDNWLSGSLFIETLHARGLLKWDYNETQGGTT
jgi:hypothetical protein